MRNKLLLTLSWFLMALFALSPWAKGPSQRAEDTVKLYQWAESPAREVSRVKVAHERLLKAIQDPEYILKHWVELPTAPKPRSIKTQFLTLRDAVLLALRYNPNIQNAELDRIIQRYQLRLAYNKFELQFALGGTALVENSRYSNAGSTTNHTALATPEIEYQSQFGTKASLKMDNSVATVGNYNPLVSFNLKQPLLRGFGKAANAASLLNAKDSEWLNKLQLQQAVMDQITKVIISYRALIISGNNLINQQRQLQEARKTYESNQKKINAGELERTANIQQSYQIESLNLNVEQAENDFRISAQDLLQTIGLDPQMKLAVPSDVSLKKLIIPDVKASTKQALCHNTQYLALKMAYRANQRAYKVAKNQQLWQLDLSANVQASLVSDVEGGTGRSQSVYNGKNITQSAGVTLTIPIRDLNRRDQLISAKVQLEKDRINLIAAKRALITTVKNTINNIESQAKRYELALRQVTLAEKSYELEKKKQAAGIASSLDVHNTQNQLLQAQNGLINAKVAYLNELSSLQRMLGTTLKHWDITLRYSG